VPTYQYACNECGHQLEAVQSFSDDPLTVCPSCEGKLRKVFSSVGVVFKGSGFYRTDSRAGASASESAKPSTNGSSSSGSSSSSESSSSGSSTSAPSSSSTVTAKSA
jgi:putative FmdB family regulatory protein